MAQGPNKDKAESEQQFDSPAGLFEPIEKARKYLKYWKTRKAVLHMEPLYDYPKKKLEELGYFGTWEFNLIQSTLSALPSLLIFGCARLLHLEFPKEAVNETFTEVLRAFGIPFTLTLTAYVLGRASLWKPDATEAARKRAARIYLYFDGAYGFYPQMAFSATYAVATLNPGELSALFLAVLAFSWQAGISLIVIPLDLFDRLGYGFYIPDVERRWTTLFRNEAKAKEFVVFPIKPPLRQYWFSVLYIVPVMAYVVRTLCYYLAEALRALLGISGA
jgi:hypothetical protein